MQNAATIERFSKLKLEKRPAYIGSNQHDLLEKIYAKRADIIMGLTYGTALSYFDDNIAARFFDCATKIEEDCMMVSSPYIIQMNPAYQEIISMGEKAIPLLIQKLDYSPIFWFPALEIISNQNPVPYNHKGFINLMVEDWKIWAISNKYAG